MIDQTTVLWASGVVSLASAVVCGALWRSVPPAFRRVAAATALVPIVATIGVSLDASGVGNVIIGERAVNLPDMGADVLAYGVLFGVTARLAGVSGRFLAVLIAVPVIERVVFGVSDISPLVAILTVVGGHSLIVYLFVRPVWRQAQNVPPAQRLLHWKGRNLLLFLMGVLILYAVLLVIRVFPYDLVGFTALEYVRILVRAGVPTYFLLKLTQLDAVAQDSVQTADAPTTDTVGVSGSDD